MKFSQALNGAVLAFAAEVAAAPTTTTFTATSVAGSQTSDVFPPSGTTVNSSQFPGESSVGFPGATQTGVEPAAAQTAAIYPYNNKQAGSFPLAAAQPHGSGAFSDNL